MKIALDAMGGDHAPKEIVLGALDALQKYEMLDKIYLVGQRDKIEAELSQNNGLQHAKIEIVEASEVIEMADPSRQCLSAQKRCVHYSGDPTGEGRYCRCGGISRQHRRTDGGGIVWAGPH